MSIDTPMKPCSTPMAHNLWAKNPKPSAQTPPRHLQSQRLLLIRAQGKIRLLGRIAVEIEVT